MSVTEILEAISNLSPEDRAQVKALLDTLAAAPVPHMTGEEFARRLAAKEIATLPESLTDEDFAEEDAWKPIEVKGAPLSEIIIEERR